MSIEKLPFGIISVVGKPGAGKSYYLTRKAVEAVTVHRRPVYTNLPIRWRVMWHWIAKRYGRECARLIHPLSEEHMLAFLDRFEQMQQFKDELIQSGQAANAKMALRMWREHCDRTGDRDRIESEVDQDGNVLAPGNWISAGAVVIVDECHHWFPNPALPTAKASKKREPANLLTWLTMHRHMMHEIYFASQAVRQLTTTIKSLVLRQIAVRNGGEDQLAWGLRFKHLGLKPMRYLEYDGDADPDGTPPPEPLRAYSFFPQLPQHCWVFRLYSSFTHAGSANEIKRAIMAERDQAGILEASRKAEEMNRVKSRFFLYRLLGFSTRWGIRGVAFCLAVALGFWFADQGPTEEIAAEEVSDVRPASLSELVGALRVTSITEHGVRFSDGTTVREGATLHGLQIAGVFPDQGFACCLDPDTSDVWVCVAGEGVERIGPYQAVLAAIASSREPGAAPGDSIPGRDHSGPVDGGSMGGS